MPPCGEYSPMKRLLHELLIFLVLFLLLSFAMHASEFMSDPLNHIRALTQSPLGALHPLYITFGVYLFLLWPVRLALRKIGEIIDSRKR